MPSDRVTPACSRSRILAIIAIVIFSLAVISGSLTRAESLVAVAAQVTEVPPTVPPPPTNPPPTPIPPTPVPTQIPPTPIPPTEVPPTDVPPTEIPPTEIPPTEIPPTEEPTVTPIPTQTPNPFPRTPTVPPVNPPVQPPPASGPSDAGDITITCTPVSNDATPAVEAGPWDLQRCTVPDPFATVSSLDIRAISSDPGWRVILVDPTDAQAPGLLNASNNRAVITHRPGQPDSTFLLGTQRTCSAIGSTSLRFDLIGTSGATSVTASGTLDLAAPTTVDPTVTLQQLAVTDTVASVEVSYESMGEPACPQQVSISLPGVNGVEITDLTGPEGIRAVTIEGIVIITIPPSADRADISLALEFRASIPSQILLEALVHP